MAENKLTDKHLRGLKPGPSEKTLGDGGGLWVRVMPTDKGGSINFYYRFQFGGKERRYNCGTYPDISLAMARQAVARLIMDIIENPAVYANKSLGVSEPNTDFPKPSFY